MRPVKWLSNSEILMWCSTVPEFVPRTTWKIACISICTYSWNHPKISIHKILFTLLSTVGYNLRPRMCHQFHEHYKWPKRRNRHEHGLPGRPPTVPQHAHVLRKQTRHSRLHPIVVRIRRITWHEVHRSMSRYNDNQNDYINGQSLLSHQPPFHWSNGNNTSCTATKVPGDCIALLSLHFRHQLARLKRIS